jgi:methionyl-tRNA synthetase
MIRLDKRHGLDMARWTEVARGETTRALGHTSDWMSISRSVEWGVPIPFDPGRTVFSWADSLLAVPMAFSTVQSLRGLGEDVSTIYCMGRDNVPFYTILHPTLLRHLKADFLVPAVVVANHDICFDGLPCSKSQSRTIDLESAIRLLPSDYWRAYLVSIFPMTSNADFSPIDFDEFARVSLKELDDYVRNVHRLCVTLGGHGEVTGRSAAQVSRIGGLLRDFQNRIECYDFSSAMALVFETVTESNARFSAGVPDARGELSEFRDDRLREMFALTPLISIFMPDAAKRIRETFTFTAIDRGLGELHRADFGWDVREHHNGGLFPDTGLESAMAKIRDMVVSIEFSDSIDYASDRHPVRIKWDACNCETWYQACAVPTGDGRHRDEQR